MHNHSRSFILFMMLFVLSVALEAESLLTAKREVANLGDIAFGKSATIEFVLQWSGDVPLYITDVQTACECVVADISKKEIEPGGEDTIKIEFDAQMLGVFQKEVDVYTTAAADVPLRLYLQGRVVVKQDEDYDLFPIDMGNLRLSTAEIEFQPLRHGEVAETEIRIVNMGRTAITPYIMHLPSYLLADFSPEILPAGRTGRLLITFDSEQVVETGFLQTNIYLASNQGEKISEENKIRVSTLVLPRETNFATGRIPKMSLSTDSLNIGVFGKRKKKTGLVTLTNTGSATLEIYSLQVLENSLELELSNKIIEQGEIATLKVTVYEHDINKNGNRFRVLLITNSLDEPYKIISVYVE